MAGIRDRIVGLRRVRAADLVPSPYNWRRHPPAQQRALEAMLEQIGYADALIARELPDGRLELVDGHLRASTTPEAEVPVLVLDLDDEEARMVLATLDPLAAMAETDGAAIAALLDSIKLPSEELVSFMAGMAKWEPPVQVEDPGPQIDRAEELREKWGIERGQIWQVGRHRVMCGDATSAEDVEMLLAGAKPRLMVTDPPYGVDYDAGWREVISHAPGRRMGKVENDDRADWGEAWKLSPSAVAYTWAPAGPPFVEHDLALRTGGYEPRMTMIWAKSNFPISRGHYHVRHEPCLYAVRKGETAGWIGGHDQTTLWQINLDHNVDGGHSTQKPLECMARPIRNHEGDVYDPFVGSGTTLVAAEQLGRIGYGMDISPGYVAVTLERLAGMGLEPVLAP